MTNRIAILASGNGTNAMAIIKKAREGTLLTEIPLIICNLPSAGIIGRAKKIDVPCAVVDHHDFANREEHDLEMIRLIREANCNIIALAGYMRLLSPVFFKEIKEPILNIHPALLPSFPGLHGIGEAFEYGVKLTGPTVHFVEEKMDSGPIIIQAATVIKDDDTRETLEERIHALEHRIYPQALQWVAQKRLAVRDRKVELMDGNKKKAELTGMDLIWPPLEEGF